MVKFLKFPYMNYCSSVEYQKHIWHVNDFFVNMKLSYVLENYRGEKHGYWF